MTWPGPQGWQQATSRPPEELIDRVEIEECRRQLGPVCSSGVLLSPCADYPDCGDDEGPCQACVEYEAARRELEEWGGINPFEEE